MTDEYEMLSHVAELSQQVNKLQELVVSLLQKNDDLAQAIGKTGAYTQQLDQAFAKALTETNQRMDRLVGPVRNGAPLPEIISRVGE